MLRQSILIILASTAALGLAISEASARGAMGTFAGVRAANPNYVTSNNVYSGPDAKFSALRYARGGAAAIHGSEIKPNRITPAYVKPSTAIQIKPNYGSTLKPLPVPPIAAAKNYPGAGVVTPTPTPTMPPMHWPHHPGVYGTPAIVPAPLVTTGLAAPSPASNARGRSTSC